MPAARVNVNVFIILENNQTVLMGNFIEIGATV